jgi:hypothetical protein
MATDKNLGSFIELTLRTKDQYLGDRILTFYCINCGYIEICRSANFLLEIEKDPRKQPHVKHK